MEGYGGAHLLLDQPTPHVGLSASHSQLNQRKFTFRIYPYICCSVFTVVICSPLCRLYLDGTDNAHAQMHHFVLQIEWTACKKNGKLFTAKAELLTAIFFLPSVQDSKNKQPISQCLLFTFGKEQQSISSEFRWLGLQKRHRATWFGCFGSLKKMDFWSDFTTLRLWCLRRTLRIQARILCRASNRL